MPEAGWYDDPGGAGLRWWDGTGWTAHVRPSAPAIDRSAPTAHAERPDVVAARPPDRIGAPQVVLALAACLLVGIVAFLVARGLAGGSPVPTIEGFEDLVLLARGGFSSVYRAWQPSAARRVAIKVLDSTLDAESRPRFERECRALGAVAAHPAICTLYASGETAEGHAYLVLERSGEGAGATSSSMVRRAGRIRSRDGRSTPGCG